MVDEARAVEQDVDRPDFARQRCDRFSGTDVELAPVRVETFEAVEIDVGRDDPRPFIPKALAVARPMPAAAAVRTATLPANRSAIENAPRLLISLNDDRPSPRPRRFSRHIAKAERIGIDSSADRTL